MDEGYIGRKSKNWLLPIIILGIVIVAGSGIFIWFKSQEKMVSPIPKKPSFEVIFYTPTPGAITPTSTPSATPKVKKSPTATIVPTKTVTITITPTIKVATPSPTIKATVTPK